MSTEQNRVRWILQYQIQVQQRHVNTMKINQWSNCNGFNIYLIKIEDWKC